MLMHKNTIQVAELQAVGAYTFRSCMAVYQASIQYVTTWDEVTWSLRSVNSISRVQDDLHLVLLAG
jgi:hypothetical protein